MEQKKHDVFIRRVNGIRKRLTAGTQEQKKNSTNSKPNHHLTDVSL